MRPWLVVVGVVFLTLTAGTLAALYFAGEQNPKTSTLETPYPRFTLASNETEILLFAGYNGTTEQFNLTWHSSSPVVLILEQFEACTEPCNAEHVLVNWSTSLSGAWTGNGPFVYPLRCVLQDPHPRDANVSLTGRSVATNPTRLSWEVLLVVGAGAAGLLVVGGLAIFLGVFLRVDPYGPEPPLVSRSADDVEELGPAEPPNH